MLNAYCGIDCRNCEAYQATLLNDDELRRMTAKAWAEKNQAPILPEHINCSGCREDGLKTFFCESLCPVRSCAMSKNQSDCRLCPDSGNCKMLHSLIQENEKLQKVWGLK